MKEKDVGFGARILHGMGWTEGTGLGAKRDGAVEPLSVSRRKENLGIGAERRPFKDSWWQKMMEDAYGKPEESSSEEDKEKKLFDACEGRRCRPHGKSKLDRLAKHDKAAAKLNSQPQKEGELVDSTSAAAVTSGSEGKTDKSEHSAKRTRGSGERTISDDQAPRHTSEETTPHGSTRFIEMAKEAGVVLDSKYSQKLDKLIKRHEDLPNDEEDGRRKRKETKRKIKDVEKRILKKINKAVLKKKKATLKMTIENSGDLG